MTNNIQLRCDYALGIRAPDYGVQVWRPSHGANDPDHGRPLWADSQWWWAAIRIEVPKFYLAQLH